MSNIRVNPRYSISSASSTGSSLTYIANNAFVVGERIIVSGSSNSNFDTSDSVVVSATSTQFSITKPVSASATSTGGIAYKVFSDWKTPTIVNLKINGEWRQAIKSWVKIDGVWRTSPTFAGPPERPIMEYISTGVFEITNYDSKLIYQAIFKTGSGGTATLNTSNGRYTLSGENSGFDVIARYAAGAQASDPGYMERKKYTYSCRQVPYECCSDCNCSCYLDADCYCTDVWGNCQPGHNPSWGQCGCGPMCWIYNNGVVCNCDTCCDTCYQEICDVLVNQPGYKDSGTEWYKDNI